MKDFSIFVLIVWAIVAALLVVSFFGCQTFRPRPPIIDNPRDALIQTVIKTDWITTIALLGMAVAVAAMVNGSRTAFPAFAGCGFALWSNLTVIRYAGVMAWFGLAASVLIFVYVVFVKNRALKEIVAGVENFKNHGGTLIGCLNDQKVTTKKIVSGIKTKNGLTKGETK